MFQKTYLQFDKWEVLGRQICRRSHILQIYLFQFRVKDIGRNAVAALLRAYGNIFFLSKRYFAKKTPLFYKIDTIWTSKINVDKWWQKNVLIYTLVRVNFSEYIIWHFASLSGNWVKDKTNKKSRRGLCFFF